MSEEDKAAFNLIQGSLSDMGKVITSIREGQLLIDHEAGERHAQLARDLAVHQAKIADDLARYNKEQSDRVNEIAADLAEYKYQTEIFCNERHTPITARLVAIESIKRTEEHAEDQVAQKEQGWGSKWNVYLYPIGILVSIAIALFGMFKK